MFLFWIALLAGKLTKACSRLLSNVFHKSGTNLPGLVALKICPEFIRYADKPETVVTITGTNGKTTTTNMVADILDANGYHFYCNRLGSNINSGIASSLIDMVTLANKNRYKLAVLEADERSAPRIYPYLTPTYTICTNLFRDSLMRNAHPHFIFDLLDQYLPDSTTMILNADDLLSGSLKKNNPRVFFSIDRQSADEDHIFNLVNDMPICPNCQTKLVYDYVRYNQIGHAHCPKCGLTSPEGDWRVTTIDRENQKLHILHEGREEVYPLAAKSIFNIYNELSAITLLRTYGLSKEEVEKGLSTLKIVKTRYREDVAGSHRILTTMAKSWISPACSAVFRYVSRLPEDKELVIMLEDDEINVTSSEGLTYIYETDFEFLNQPNIHRITFVGVRGKDFLYRMLMAGVPKEKVRVATSVEELPKQLLLEEGMDIHILFDMHQEKACEQIRETIIKTIRERESQ